MESPKEKLVLLMSEASQQHVDEIVDFLSKTNTPEEFVCAMNESKTIWGASYIQTLGPMMMKLYSQDTKVKNLVHSEVGKLGVSDSAIRSYFTNYILAGEIAVNMLMGDDDDEIPDDKKQPFIESTNQLMLDIIKTYTGLKKII